MLSNDELKRLYGKEYVEAFKKKKFRRRLERLIDLMDLKLSDNVCDIACGDGSMLPLVTSKVAKYTGVDFSTDFIKSAKNKRRRLNIPNAEFVCSDIVRFCSLHIECFDVAFAMDFSEHVYDETWVEILVAIRKSIKHGGRLFLHTPNADYFVELMKSIDFILKQFPEHIAVRTPRRNCELLEQAGYKINSINLLSHYNRLRILHPLSFFPVIGKWFKARIFIEASV